MKKIRIISLFTAYIVLSISQIHGQLPPFTICLDEGDAFVGLDRKAWTGNVADVSESYQLDFQIPDVPPYECVVIDRVEFTINGYSSSDMSGCVSINWTHVLNCSSNAPISCDTDPFDCCNVDDQGLNNWIVTNEDDDLFDGQTLAFDIVAVVDDNPACPKDVISMGLYSASFEVCMELYYEPDFAEEELELEDDPTICSGQTYELEGPSGYESYEWQGPIDSDDRTLENAIPGIYTLTVSDDRGCTSSDEIEIIADGGFEVSFNQSNPFTVCSQTSETLEALINNTLQSNDYDFDWTSPGGNSSSDNSIDIDISGTYTVEVTDTDTDCMVTESIDVILTQLSPAQIDSISMPIINTCDPSVNVEAFVPSTDNTTYTYEWINGTDTVRTKSIQITESGTYILNLLNDIGCPTTSDTVEVNITPPLVAGQDNQVEECNDQVLDLDAYLNGNTSTGGTWEVTNGTGTLTANQYDPMSEVGIVTFDYIVNNPPPCDNDTSSITILLNESYSITIDDVLCEDDFIIVNGMTYDQNLQSGEENMLSANGCDSTVIINLTFIPESSSLLDSELCSDDFRIINGVTYDINNPTGIETLMSSNGCDSTVTINLDFVDEINTDLTEVLCTDDFRIVNGVTYNNTNPSGRETLMSINGCDSVVTIDLTFIDEINITFDPELCPDASEIINGVIYDITNPTGSETLQSVSGCDSIITIDINFSDPIITPIELSLCPGDFREVNGTTYDQSNPNGTEILQANNGCDSTVVIDLSYLPDTPITEETLTFCDSIFVIDEWIYQAGLVIDTLSDINGCDSTINTTVELGNCLKSIETTFSDLSCFGVDDGIISIEVLGEYDYPIDYTVNFNANTITQDQLLQEGIIEINMLTSGSYTIELTDNNNIILYTETIEILSPDQLEVMLTQEVPIECNGDLNGQVSSIITGGAQGSIDYLWSDMSTGTELTDIGAGLYSITVEDDNNCTAENSITIEEPEALIAQVTATNIECNSSDGGSIEISDISGGIAPYESSIDGNIFDDNIIYTNLSADTYVVTVRDANNCIYEETIDIISESTFTISPIDTVRIVEGSSATIDLNLDFTPASINWSPGTDLSCDDCEMTEASPSSDVSYIVTVIDDMGCEIITEVYVKVTPVEIITEPIDVYFPNTFSVIINDGINDTFKPLTTSDVDLIITSLIIYDRWGNIVHQEEGLVEGWDGYIDNTPAVGGVYLYKMNYNIEGRENINVGSITLIN